jgi:hypothetical protein
MTTEETDIDYPALEKEIYKPAVYASSFPAFLILERYINFLSVIKFMDDCSTSLHPGDNAKEKTVVSVIHTDDCEIKSGATDNEIRMLAKKKNRTVITKDNDFLIVYSQ